MKIEKTLLEIDIEKFKLFFEERTSEKLRLRTLSKFDDKVEITSPGKLMPSVDFNLMEAGQSESKKSYTPESAEKMSENILWLIKENPEISAKELAYIVNRSSRTIERAIAKLKKEGRIKRIGPDKGGYWDVIECTE